jgi:hypothetical protein
MNPKRASSIAVLTVCLCSGLSGQPPQGIRVDSVQKLEVADNLKADIGGYRGHAAVRIVNVGTQESAYGSGLAIVRGTSFREGTIEVTLAGDTAPDAPPQLRGFVGIAFRVIDRSHFELFYIRPKNGRSGDQLQRNHSTQYMSMPGYPWDKLRSESPGKYESYVDLVPGLWTKLKVQVKGKMARFYVNGAMQPALIVNDLKQPVSDGKIALWVGQGTIAHFAGLSITP